MRIIIVRPGTLWGTDMVIPKHCVVREDIHLHRCKAYVWQDEVVQKQLSCPVIFVGYYGAWCVFCVSVLCLQRCMERLGGAFND